MLVLFFALLIIHARHAPDSGLGRAMNRLTAQGLRRLASIRPLTIFCFVAVAAAFAALIAYGKIEGLIMAGLAAPETFAVFLALDVGTAVEVLVIAWLTAGRTNLGAVVRNVRSACETAARWARRRPRSCRAARKPAKFANDDDQPGSPLPWPARPVTIVELVAAHGVRRTQEGARRCRRLAESLSPRRSTMTAAGPSPFIAPSKSLRRSCSPAMAS